MYYYAGSGSVIMKGVIRVLPFRTNTGPISFTIDGENKTFHFQLGVVWSFPPTIIFFFSERRSDFHLPKPQDNVCKCLNSSIQHWEGERWRDVEADDY